VAKFREDDVTPSNQSRIRGKYHIGPPISVRDILNPSAKPNNVMMEIAPLLNRKPFLRRSRNIHPRIYLVAHIVVNRSTHKPSTVWEKR
jgi:hypothetical protein